MSASPPVPAFAPVSPADRRDSRLWLSRRGVAGLLIAWLVTRWIFDSFHDLVPDEAYYWIWSRHLALGYFDHPPMVAYLIRLGTMLLGETELGVRCLAGVATAGTVVILTLIGRRMIGDGRAASFIPIALLLSPMIAAVGSIVTPDTPACFFQSAALAAVLGIFVPKPGDARTRVGWRWIGFGILLGLALDSKYTSVLLGVSVLLALLSCGEGRRQLRTPWPWLGAIAALGAWSPVIFWNAHHHWASFRFQLEHGLRDGDSTVWNNLLNYVGGQLGICTPVLLVVCVVTLVIYWRRKNNPMPVRILLYSATLPLLFFAYSATRRRVEANWPMFAYFPAIILFGQYLAEHWGRRRVFWAEVALKVSLVITILIQVPELVWRISPNIGAPQWDHLFGWRELATSQVQPLRRGSPVFTADYEYASELSFYLPNQPEVRPLADANRPTAFDFLPEQPVPESFGRVVLVRRLPKGYDPPAVWHPLGPEFIYTSINEVMQPRYRRQIRRSLIEVAERSPYENH